MKLLLMQFSSTSYYFNCLSPNILLSTMFPNTLISYIYKNKGRVIGLYRIGKKKGRV
jgi:hypothetical protein